MLIISRRTLTAADCLIKEKRFVEARISLNRVIALEPTLADAYNNRAAVSLELKEYQDALADCDHAISLTPNFADAYSNRASALNKLKRRQEALASYDKALALRPDLAGAWLGRGNVYSELKLFDKALAAYDRALALRPNLAEAWLCRGHAMAESKHFSEALATYDKALAIDPHLAAAWLGRANIFLELKRHDEALVAIDNALALRSDLAEAWLGRGNIFCGLRRFGDAVVAYDNALRINAELPDTQGAYLHAKMQCCDWDTFADDTSSLITGVRNGLPVAQPFVLLGLPSSPSDQFAYARRFSERKLYNANTPLWRSEAYSHSRIRIAYLSADFHDHATAHLMAGLFEQHDRTRFQTVAVSFGPDDVSATRQRMTAAFDRFFDVRAQSDRETAHLVRSLEIDIAVDLKGYTEDSRPNILAMRPAPLQVNYLGYPGTMGTDRIDYILADTVVIPPDQQEYYSEKVIWLPHSYQANDATRRISPATPSRRDAGLPETGFVFCSFNNSYKITPSMFDVWMRLLKQINGSVLWLLEGNAFAPGNLRREAQHRGIAAERLVFAPRNAHADHLARHRLADLFLDTLPYNAHTTASDALWAGLPVVTCLGSTFAGRVAASLLSAVGLRELITRSLEDYEALILKLAREPALLAAIRRKLATNRNTCPLFDTARFARHVETAYTTIWERQQRGEAPRAFSVGPAADSRWLSARVALSQSLRSEVSRRRFRPSADFGLGATSD